MSDVAERETTFARDKDPYVMDPANIQEPPTSLKGSLKFLGPGMITSAAVVGSGELLTATTLGAKVGFMLFWLVFVSTFVKVWVQIELGRWSISTGKAAITGYNQVPPKIAGRGWMAWLVLLMFLQFLIGQAGVISASAFAFATLFPIGPDPYSFLSIGVWVAILACVAIAVHITNRYELLENLSPCSSRWSRSSRSSSSSSFRARTSPGARAIWPTACDSRWRPVRWESRCPCSG